MTNSVCEDTIYVLIFSSSLSDDIGSWKSLCDNINMSLKSLSQEYLWHKDEFKVSLPILEETLGLPLHLVSATCYGDNIEDEWFIVYLLLEISKQYKDLIIQATDSDGDFLMIEAANCLPSWANPESTNNRVFISNNKIHLIPPTLADLKIKLTLMKSIQLITKFPEETIASMEIQKAIMSRICQYPEKISENFHKALVSLPIELAALLTLKPSLISSIVESYFSHDIIDEKYCRKISYEKFIITEVKFSKFLYAMLVHSKLIQNVNCGLERENNKQNVLGLKLLCGFQILMNKLKKKDTFCSKGFTKFVNNLKEIGFFRENIEGSKDYNELLEKAKLYYSDTECPNNEYVYNSIIQLMSTNDFLAIKNKLSEENQNKIMVEDDDEWLNVQPNQLNDFLNARYGEKIKFKQDDFVSSETFTSKLTEFLNKTSDFEGIEKTEPDGKNDCINFDSNEFVNCLEKMMKLCSSEKCYDFSNSESESDFESNNTDVDEDLLKEELDKKLQSTLSNTDNSKSVLVNFTQSIKEEVLSGPSSNLLRTIGINKTDMLDSDDDE